MSQIILYKDVDDIIYFYLHQLKMADILKEYGECCKRYRDDDVSEEDYENNPWFRYDENTMGFEMFYEFSFYKKTEEYDPWRGHIICTRRMFQVKVSEWLIRRRQ